MTIFGRGALRQLPIFSPSELRPRVPSAWLSRQLDSG
jgi:hypothetical protein